MNAPTAVPANACLSEDQVLGFVTGALKPEAIGLAEEHLNGCEACALLISTLARPTHPAGAARPHPLRAFQTDELLAGRYRVLRPLGKGGMGEVYEALDTVLGEPVALKTVALDVAPDGPWMARMKAEVQLARRVTHRNVCRVFDLAFHVEPARAGAVPVSPVPLLTMELLSGGTLRSHLRKRGRLPAAEALAILEQLAAALDAAHAAGVVHADLKSDNIMLVEEASGTRAVITDFGLARRAAAESQSRLSSGLIGAGTVGYMAPEQASGQPPAPPVDVYALGVVLFEMLTGRLPFEGQTAIAVALAAARERPPSLKALVPTLPLDWDAVIRRCLATDPARRFARASDVVTALHTPRARRRALALGGVALAVVGFAIAWGRRRAVPAMPAIFPAAAPPAAVSPPGPPGPPPSKPAFRSDTAGPPAVLGAAPPATSNSRAVPRPRPGAGGPRGARAAPATSSSAQKPDPGENDAVFPY
jgi:Protein kinase domain